MCDRNLEQLVGIQVSAEWNTAATESYETLENTRPMQNLGYIKDH